MLPYWEASLQLGRNTYIVPIGTERHLPRHVGESLDILGADGVPDDHLVADRGPASLTTRYSGSVAAFEKVPVWLRQRRTQVSGPCQQSGRADRPTLRLAAPMEEARRRANDRPVRRRRRVSYRSASRGLEQL